MDRRDFIRNGLLAAAAGTIGGGKALAHEAGRQAGIEQMSKDILNYNPQMQYRPMGRTGVNVSALGFGMLRLPMKDGHVDFDQTTPMVRRAIEGGVNYIDTGRVYMGGESEQAVAKALAGGWRDRVYVTSKLPWWSMQSADDFDKFFDQSRRTLDTDVIDFFHIHMIMHRAWKDYVLPYKLIDKMENLKAQGKIRYMGFSFHDSLQLFKKVVEYTPAWDFCLIQHNYLDYEYEAGVLGPKYAAANGMGLAVMKPVRTGFLILSLLLSVPCCIQAQVSYSEKGQAVPPQTQHFGKEAFEPTDGTVIRWLTLTPMRNWRISETMMSCSSTVMCRAADYAIEADIWLHMASCR